MGQTTRDVHDFVNGETPDASTWDGLPKGWQLVATSDTDIGAITGTFTQLAGANVNLLASRRLLVTYSVDVQSTVAGDLASARVLLNSSTVICRSRGVLVWANGPGRQTLSQTYIINMPAGNNFLEVQLARENGTGTLTGMSGAIVTLVDIGPF